MTKSTPGPWKAHEDNSMQSVEVWAFPDSRNAVIAPVAGKDYAERKANAALIAAAPEMLCELKMLLIVHQRKVHNKLSRGDNEAANLAQAHVDRITAIIAKAAGETP